MKINLKDSLTTYFRGLIQYDFGQTVEIYNTKLNINNVEFQFIQSGKQIDQLGTYDNEKDCYIVSIPDSFLNNDAEISCYIYVENETTGKTKKIINFEIASREMYDAEPDEKTKSLLAEIMDKLNTLQNEIENFQLTEEQSENVVKQVITALGNSYYTKSEVDNIISAQNEMIGKSMSDISNSLTSMQNSISKNSSDILKLTSEVETANAVLDEI